MKWAFYSLTSIILLNTATLAPAAAQAFPYSQCHLETGVEKPTYASLTFKVTAPSLLAQNWLFLAPLPPELPGQIKTRTSVAVDGARPSTKFDRELSNQRRPILSVLVPANTSRLQKELTVKVNYWATEVPRHLKPGHQGSRALITNDASNFLSASDTYDFTSSSFQNWLTANSLRRRGFESNLDFAWRAFFILRSKYSYNYNPNQDRRASALCNNTATDCGGISFLFVSTLRANNIPARARVGRWTKANTTDGQHHVKSEFFAREHGWIPVELSGAISDKNSDPMLFFGQENGDFMTLHLDPDIVVDSIWFGKGKMMILQNPIYYVTGGGSLNNANTQIEWRAQPIAAY